MFDNVAAFDGDSTMIKIFPLPAVLTVLTAVDFLAAVFFVVLVVLVFEVFAAEAVFFAVFFTLASVSADVFFDAGIVITPV